MKPLRFTRQELANALQAWVAMDADGTWTASEISPIHGQTMWDAVDGSTKIIPEDYIVITDPPDDWRDSLTAPKGESTNV